MNIRSGCVAILVDINQLPAIHSDLLWLHRFRNFADEFDRQQAVRKIGLFHPHEVGQLETPLETAIGDANMQEFGAIRVWAIFLASDNLQQILLSSDIDFVRPKARHRERNPISVLRKTLDIERGIVVALLQAGIGAFILTGRGGRSVEQMMIFLLERFPHILEAAAAT